MSVPLAVYENFPGLRDHSGARASYDGHGIDEILDVIGQLSSADIPSCVVGVRALRYFGAARVTDEWDLCVPDDKLETARLLLLDADGGAKYEVAKPPFQIPSSLRHTFPCFRLNGYNFYFILVPSTDCFVDPSSPGHVERSKNGVPYASLIQFARSLLMQQLWADVQDFIDGMDLDIEWGMRNIGFETLQGKSVQFLERRNQQLKSHGCGSTLVVQNLEQMWCENASREAKERRIEPMKQGRYFTRWRRIRSPEDPRTKDRPV